MDRRIVSVYHLVLVGRDEWKHSFKVKSCTIIAVKISEISSGNAYLVVALQ